MEPKTFVWENFNPAANFYGKQCIHWQITTKTQVFKRTVKDVTVYGGMFIDESKEETYSSTEELTLTHTADLAEGFVTVKGQQVKVVLSMYRQFRRGRFMESLHWTMTDEAEKKLKGALDTIEFFDLKYGTDWDGWGI